MGLGENRRHAEVGQRGEKEGGGRRGKGKRWQRREQEWRARGPQERGSEQGTRTMKKAERETEGAAEERGGSKVEGAAWKCAYRTLPLLSPERMLVPRSFQQSEYTESS